MLKIGLLPLLSQPSLPWFWSQCSSRNKTIPPRMWDNFISCCRSPISLSGQSGVMPIANKYTRAQAACLSETFVAWVVAYNGLEKGEFQEMNDSGLIAFE